MPGLLFIDTANIYEQFKNSQLYRSVNNEQNRENTDSNFNSSGLRYCFKIHNVGDLMEKAKHGGARAGAGRKKGSTADTSGYKNGRIVISCLESEEIAIKQKAKEQNKTVSRLIVDLVLDR